MTPVDPDAPLVPLPSQPDGVPWPTGRWPIGPGPAPALEALVDHAFDDTGPLARTFAVAVVHQGRLVLERAGGELEHWDGTTEEVTVETPLTSWSIAKSVLHAAVGILVGDGLLDLETPAPVPTWGGADDPRRTIVLEHLLAMRDGLDFTEDYVDAGISDVMEMLFGAGEADVAAFAADRPLGAPPGTRFNYSSGTTNIISGIVARVVGGRAEYETLLRERLFSPIGMHSATPTFDAAGTWVASSYLHATARDFARFGLLYLRGGEWDGCRVLPEGWVDHARRARSVDPTDGSLHGAQWWVVGDERGSFWAAGYEGQSILVCPGLDAVVVRLGKTSVDHEPDLRRWRADVLETFAIG